MKRVYTHIPATVKKIEENQLLKKVGGLDGIITFDHRYVLQSVANGTMVIIHEEYRGIMVPFWNPEPVGKSYKRLAKALRSRVIRLQKDKI